MPYKTEDGRLGVSQCDYDESKEAIQQFIIDAENCELEVFHYEGRYNWEGPAVIVDGIGDFYTEVKTQHDNMGLSFVVYPAKKAKMIS